MNANKRPWARVCPFCNKVHYLRSRYMNVRCKCGGKYYANTGDWINRVTGEKVEALKSKCGCERCKQHKINKDETGFNCISFGFTRRILLNIVECEESLTLAQKEAFTTVIETIEKLDQEVKL